MADRPPGWNEVWEWDVVNWSRSLAFWKSKSQLELDGARVLELGSRRGGLSLMVAQAGAQVVCSDLGGPADEARSLHRKFGVEDSVEYQDVNAAGIPYEDESFDMVIFKSVLGALGVYDAQAKVLWEIHRVLRPGGELWFAENLVGAPFHRLARRLFVPWGARWRYLTHQEILELTEPFRSCTTRRCGFFGTFGRTERQRSVLGRIDRAVDSLVFPSWRYICFGVARK